VEGNVRLWGKMSKEGIAEAVPAKVVVNAYGMALLNGWGWKLGNKVVEVVEGDIPRKI